MKDAHGRYVFVEQNPMIKISSMYKLCDAPKTMRKKENKGKILKMN